MTDDDKSRAPRPISEQIHEMNIVGYLLPLGESEGPITLQMTGSASWYLPLYSTREKLQAASESFDFTYETIKVITDQREFLSAVPKSLILILDPYIADNGRVRYRQLFPDI